MEVNIVPSNKTHASTLGFTNDQRLAYDELIEFINTEFDKDNFKKALVGPAGTGKTYLIRALIKNCNRSYSSIGLAAPTHKACRVLDESVKIPNIKTNTLQSDLGLRINFDLEKFNIDNPPFDPKGRIKIGNYKIYIVDEASMINRGLVTFLERTCISNKCKLIYIGDDSQLSPVGEKYSAAFRNIKTYNLNEIVRQEEDNPVRELLELLRHDVKHKTFTFLNHISKNLEKFDDSNIKGFRVCTAKEFEDLVILNFSDEQLTKNVDYCKIISYTNLNVSSWNKFVRNVIIKDAEKSIVTNNDLFISYTTIVDLFNSPIIKNSEDYIIKDVVNFVHPTYGFKGFTVRFTAIHGGFITQPLFILDHSDPASVKQYVDVSNQLINAAKTSNVKIRPQRWKDYYTFKESCLLLTNIINSQGKLLFGRNLDYGFALTSHKSQGSTFDTAFVDVNDIVFDKYGHPYTDVEEINRRLYVACSRCKNKLYLRYGKY